MPNADQILAGLSAIANQHLPLAAVWHLALLVVLGALALGYRPQRRSACSALSLPLASVSALAWGEGNPFNGVLFAGLAAVLLVLGARLPRAPVSSAPGWAWVVGSATLAYAWLYPHFLDSHPFALYLVASPMGLLPCPTLSMVLGLGMLARGLSSRAFALTTGIAGLFYGLFGIVRLGVWLDAGLLFAAAAMLASSRLPDNAPAVTAAD